MTTLTPAAGIDSPPAPFPARPVRPVRVVVAEDHPLFRVGLVRSLADRSLEIAVVGEAEDGLDAFVMIRELEPDIALLDLRMPGLDGIEVCDHVAALDPQPATKLVLLSAFADPQLVWRAIEAGAAGYLDKHASHEAICDAILRVADGGIAFTDRTARGLNAGFADRGG